MDFPCKFPRHADVIADDAKRFRAMSVADRNRAFVELLNVAEIQLAAAPNRTAIESAYQAEENKWQAAHRRVFERFE